FGLEERETHTVEPHETLLGGDPEVTVRGLRDGVDRSTRKALAAFPAVADVLEDGAFRIERLRGGAAHERGDGGEQARRHRPSPPGLKGGTRTPQPRPRLLGRADPQSPGGRGCRGGWSPRPPPARQT